MRTLKQLLEQEGRVWVYLKDEETGKTFLRQAQAEGFRQYDGRPLGEISWQYVMGLHDDLTVWNVSLYNWQLSYLTKVNGTPVRVDYEKYMTGEENYLCHRSHFNGR